LAGVTAINLPGGALPAFFSGVPAKRDPFFATVTVWDVESGQELHTLSGPTDSLAAVAFSAAGTRLAPAGGARLAGVWAAGPARPLHGPAGHAGARGALASDPDGRHLVSAGRDQTVRVWDLATGRAVRTLAVAGLTERTVSAAFGPGGRLLA